MGNSVMNVEGHLPSYNSVEQKDKALKKACKEFEAIFTYELLKCMRRTVDKCGLFHGGLGEKVYESLFDMEVSKLLAGLGPHSMANLLYKQLKAMAETQTKQEETAEEADKKKGM